MPEHPDLRAPWSRSERRIPRTVVRPLQRFLAASTSSGYVLLAAVAIALVWANVWPAAYERLWRTPLVLRIGQRSIGTDLRFWIGSGLMTFFFLLVGMEIKREVRSGELRDPRAVALPAIAAVGGMVVPALHLCRDRGRGRGRPWLGDPDGNGHRAGAGRVGDRREVHAPGLKPLLLTLAIVDDIGAIVVVTFAYGHRGDLVGLVWAVAAVAAVLVPIARTSAASSLRRLGSLLWFAFLRAGMEPAIAGVVMGVLAPAAPFQRPRAVSEEARRSRRRRSMTPSRPTPMRRSGSSSPTCHRGVSRSPGGATAAAVDVFVSCRSSRWRTPAWTCRRRRCSLVAGTTVAGAIVVARLSASRSGGRGDPSSPCATRGTLKAEDRQRRGPRAGVTAGIGFTVALFIADLAFADQPLLLDAAKVGDHGRGGGRRRRELADVPAASTRVTAPR